MCICIRGLLYAVAILLNTFPSFEEVGGWEEKSDRAAMSSFSQKSTAAD